MFFSNTRFEVENGSKVSFWHNLCFGDLILKEAFPNLYGIVGVKDVSVAAHLKISGGSNQWNVNFAKASSELRGGCHCLILQVLYSTRVRQICEYKL
jgi:hypothetical protein